ncbi:bifunctional tRNA (5-methylaminomethyl-2-thiouridine)(34)-methyltransferase MnmD/FAD-dependent 5-carboxymethylaminomethyl-2-thiouridine(34) oxidoreductase MnmC [Pseudomonas plecoglossicida]|jgi:tRNA 5-methylaminomethyl-2-thiouridine biosynthesis bifunctional protein|uniref:bifunctional tRNA (5-methylaminomethyl-2-thiouridine)(34)-methyltransferase MnmD/FAD-dependent 5-carboxymethylaminomethyl-2-thiouridine(34) oxidoreductase MnmC n=1 Tax=Pseudomonas TaxID=286 RepID=UPI000C230982|nr:MULTISPECIES: bifunctional tRNA (5-methylaminomethyl-2-thiouridine)(34)-methyltransferase MnmD/FAD-dependent 5-carboxymethylaminomethyl-2-thiouridine(34) oxidoreductase MnmC [Pseudomonas]CAB5637948.1 tRNA 5-methylaminomethyl-2-thiouridine biosynthesis bifunctional protein MnmC [Pseudomonas putida]MBO2921204.1 bifunctional tRNA (5-methylaminomethyl-2-thiouridine)(34)-methyltransferase MnmD/FAD-dependent 5-carboxymethylaminomethyl-2-thiouridine(34) oxidoreductase MnmC [Pseudomonas asiatica]MCE0
MSTLLQHAQIDWDDQGRPHSRQYDDVYFAVNEGIEETRHVFLGQTRLAERFANLAPHACVVIGETGFGTGMNFYCAWQLFEQHAHAEARLHFVSVEKYPLGRDDLARAIRLWPELAAYSQPLLEQYVAVHPGFQQFTFDNGRVTLTLLIGDVLEQLPQLDAQIDVWFLDGFAPAKNPDMWTPELFAQLARLSHPGTVLGTFTTTGWVRRSLVDAGFAMKKVPGIGKKWEVMSGAYVGPVPSPGAPWYTRPAAVAGPREALVIGAGLAGSTTAASLARRGWQVTVLERHDTPAREASGNPQGVLYLKLSAHGTALSQMILAGFGYTRRQLQRLQRGHDWDACGVLQLAFDNKEAERQGKLAGAFEHGLLHSLERAEAEAIAGVALPAGGLFYPEGGWVHPPALCQQQLQHPGIRLLTHQEVLELRKVDGQWQAWAGERLLASAPVVVLAGAADILRFEPCAQLPLKRIRGQITRLPATPSSRALRTVVCAEGYVAPPRGDEHTLGASFDFHSTDLAPTVAEHQGNLALLDEISVDLAQRLGAAELDPGQLEGRAAFRCTSPDYLPIVGPVADAQAFAQAYAVLGRDARQVPDVACPWLDGLYVNSGHGSRGLITAPLSGELVAAWVCGEPLPLPRAVAEACHPNRFALRRLIRGK